MLWHLVLHITFSTRRRAKVFNRGIYSFSFWRSFLGSNPGIENRTENSHVLPMAMGFRKNPKVRMCKKDLRTWMCSRWLSSQRHNRADQNDSPYKRALTSPAELIGWIVKEVRLPSRHLQNFRSFLHRTLTHVESSLFWHLFGRVKLTYRVVSGQFWLICKIQGRSQTLHKHYRDRCILPPSAPFPQSSFAQTPTHFAL